MAGRSLTITRGRERLPAAITHPGRWRTLLPTLIRVVGPLCMFLILLVLGVMTAARTGTTPQLFDLAERDLPGSPLPDDVICYSGIDEYSPRCFVRRFGNDVYFNFDKDSRTILRTVIPAHKYSIGYLIPTWGKPSGIKQSPYMVSVHWGTRSALLYTQEFRPDSRVEFILYDPEPLPASPWRGFR